MVRRAALGGIPLHSRADHANSSYNSDEEEHDIKNPKSDDQRRFSLTPTSIQTGRSTPGSNAEVDSDGAAQDSEEQQSDETCP